MAQRKRIWLGISQVAMLDIEHDGYMLCGTIKILDRHHNMRLLKVKGENEPYPDPQAPQQVKDLINWAHNLTDHQGVTTTELHDDGVKGHYLLLIHPLADN